MAHRHFFSSFNMFGVDQSHDPNQLSAEQSYIPMGTGRAVSPENGSLFQPMDNRSAGGAYSDPRWNSEGRANECPPSFSTGVPQSALAFSAPPCDLFLHSSAAGNIYLGPENNGGHTQSNYYYRSSIRENESGLLDHATEGGRGPFKRKSPDIPGAFERGSTSRYYGAGSSSGSSEIMLEKPTSDYQNIPLGPIGLPHYRGSSLSIAGEDSSRNVRSRSRMDFEPNTTRTHLSSYFPHRYHPTTHPTNHSGQLDPGSLNTDASTRGQNYIPVSVAHGRIPTSDTNGSIHESNRLLVGGSAADIGGYNNDSVSSRYHVSPSQYLHCPPAQAAREDRSNHSRRAIPAYGAYLRYVHMGHEASSSDNGLQSLSDSSSSRYSRPSAVGGWRNNYRNRRSRIAIERFQSISSMVDTHDRMGSEDLMMVDRSSFYGSSTNLFDQHRDMRLDTDSMSYEELLALGERIGSVNTGLSEYMISKCLKENHGEGSCAICLEEYKKTQKIGTMKNCGHDYHVDCISKWLLMKNVCPICKAAALTDCSNQE